jgi:hypothetical protein
MTQVNTKRKKALTTHHRAAVAAAAAVVSQLQRPRRAPLRSSLIMTQKPAAAQDVRQAHSTSARRSVLIDHRANNKR